MAKLIQAIRGMNDVLPDQTPVWQYLENKVKQLLASYCYKEIRTPLVEPSAVFSRGIGAGTDIIEKEMYTFQDRNGEHLSLRPEGTAGCVRAGIQHGLLFNQIQRLWSSGPMFRYERPQKGRYRQFHQVSVEAFGMNGPSIDAELILLSARLWKELQLTKHVRLELNTLGSLEARQTYRESLVSYLSRFESDLDEDSRRRLAINPLRILDSKNKKTQAIIAEAPILHDHLDKESLMHFDALCQLLDDAGIEYTINKCLVRGLDYYSKTVFEWVTESLGAQGTVCAGGRYDQLIELMGGKATAGVGFAIGIERLILMLETLDLVPSSASELVDVALIALSSEKNAMVLAEQLRNSLPWLKLQLDCSGASFKGQMKRAIHSGAYYALVLNKEDVNKGMVTVKSLRYDNPQTQIAQSELANYLKIRIQE